MKILRRCMGEQNSVADRPTTLEVAGALEGPRDQILELKNGDRAKRFIRARRQAKGSHVPGEEV